MLVPGLDYVFETFIECLSDRGISDIIKVYRLLLLLLLCVFYLLRISTDRVNTGGNAIASVRLLPLSFKPTDLCP